MTGIFHFEFWLDLVVFVGGVECSRLYYHLVVRHSSNDGYHCERTEAMCHQKSEIAAACFAGLAMTIPQMTCDGALTESSRLEAGWQEVLSCFGRRGAKSYMASREAYLGIKSRKFEIDSSQHTVEKGEIRTPRMHKWNEGKNVAYVKRVRAGQKDFHI